MTVWAFWAWCIAPRIQCVEWTALQLWINSFELRPLRQLSSALVFLFFLLLSHLCSPLLFTPLSRVPSLPLLCFLLPPSLPLSALTAPMPSPCVPGDDRAETDAELMVRQTYTHLLYYVSACLSLPSWPFSTALFSTSRQAYDKLWLSGYGYVFDLCQKNNIFSGRSLIVFGTWYDGVAQMWRFYFCSYIYTVLTIVPWLLSSVKGLFHLPPFFLIFMTSLREPTLPDFYVLSLSHSFYRSLFTTLTSLCTCFIPPSFPCVPSPHFLTFLQFYFTSPYSLFLTLLQSVLHPGHE